MPIRPIKPGPLTSREIKELDEFLLAEDGPENPMDFSEWLRWGWGQEQGGQPPEFKSEAHSEPADRTCERAGIHADPWPAVL
jgi:uncharacterized protein YecA (UPF0149 family)